VIFGFFSPNGAEFLADARATGAKAPFCDRGGSTQEESWRLWGREGSDYTARYPKLAVLRRWPAGTLVDGELVLLRGGLPDLAGLLRRHQLIDPWKIRHAGRWCVR
jgi:hypothetical protein